jgi:hypothetical protein
VLMAQMACSCETARGSAILASPCPPNRDALTRLASPDQLQRHPMRRALMAAS